MGTGGQKARDLTGNNRGHFGCFGLKIKYLNGGIHKMDVFLKSKVKRCSYDTVISICLIAFCFEMIVILILNQCSFQLLIRIFLLTIK